jgi:hypothetical protein
VVACGSYIPGEQTVGDLDLAVEYKSKRTGGERKEALKSTLGRAEEYAAASWMSGNGLSLR